MGNAHHRVRIEHDRDRLRAACLDCEFRSPWRTTRFPWRDRSERPDRAVRDIIERVALRHLRGPVADPS